MLMLFRFCLNELITRHTFALAQLLCVLGKAIPTSQSWQHRKNSSSASHQGSALLRSG